MENVNYGMDLKGKHTLETVCWLKVKDVRIEQGNDYGK